VSGTFSETALAHTPGPFRCARPDLSAVASARRGRRRVRRSIRNPQCYSATLLCEARVENAVPQVLRHSGTQAPSFPSVPRLFPFRVPRCLTRPPPSNAVSLSNARFSRPKRTLTAIQSPIRNPKSAIETPPILQPVPTPRGSPRLTRRLVPATCPGEVADEAGSPKGEDGSRAACHCFPPPDGGRLEKDAMSLYHEASCSWASTTSQTSWSARLTT
jgi:hypothetical protein